MSIRNHRPAFTIVELLVVIAIIAIIAASGIGFYSGPYQQMLVQKAARDVFLGAKYARTSAIEQQKVHRLMISTQKLKLAVIAEEWDELGSASSQEQVSNMWQRPVSIPEIARFEVIDVDRTNEPDANAEPGMESIAFYPDGTAQQARIQIGDGKRHYAISVSAATGKARFVAGTIDNIIADTYDLDDNDEWWRHNLEARYE